MVAQLINAMIPDGTPILCGGDRPQSFGSSSGGCQSYDVASDKWEMYSATIFGGSKTFVDFNPDVGFIMAGGYDPRSLKVEWSDDYGQTKTDLPDVPINGPYLVGACLVIINATTVWMAGGYSE